MERNVQIVNVTFFKVLEKISGTIIQGESKERRHFKMHDVTMTCLVGSFELLYTPARIGWNKLFVLVQAKKMLLFQNWSPFYIQEVDKNNKQNIWDEIHKENTHGPFS